MTDAPAEQIVKYARLNPDAGAVEVVGALGLASEWREHVEAALADDDLLPAPELKDADDAGDNRPPEGGPPRSNPTANGCLSHI